MSNQFHELLKNEAEIQKLVATKLAELTAECNKRGSLQERIDFLLMLAAMQSVVVDGALEQLQYEVMTVRACLPKADVERAEKAIEQARAEAEKASTSA